MEQPSVKKTVSDDHVFPEPTDKCVQKIQIGRQKQRSKLAQMFENGVASCANLSTLLSFLTEHEFATNEAHPKYEQLKQLDNQTHVFNDLNQKIKHVKREFTELSKLL